MERKLYVPMILLIYVALISVYVGTWNRIITGEIPVEEVAPIISSSTGSVAEVRTQTEVESIAWSALYGYLLPSYWSRIGYLMGYHTAFFMATTVALITALGTILYKEWTIPYA